MCSRHPLPCLPVWQVVYGRNCLTQHPSLFACLRVALDPAVGPIACDCVAIATAFTPPDLPLELLVRRLPFGSEAVDDQRPAVVQAIAHVVRWVGAAALSQGCFAPASRAWPWPMHCALTCVSVACRGAGAGGSPEGLLLLPRALQQVLEQDWLLQSNDTRLHASALALLEQLIRCFAQECAQHASRLTWVLLCLSEVAMGGSSRPPNDPPQLDLLAAACGQDSGDTLVASCCLPLLKQVDAASCALPLARVLPIRSQPRVLAHALCRCRRRAPRRLGISVYCAG